MKPVDVEYFPVAPIITSVKLSGVTACLMANHHYPNRCLSIDVIRQLLSPMRLSIGRDINYTREDDIYRVE